MRVAKDPQSGFYFVRFTVGGKRQQHSTKTKIKGQADAIAQRIYQNARIRAECREPIQAVGKVREMWLAAHDKTVSAGHWKNVSTWDPCGLDKLLLDHCGTASVELAIKKFAEGRAPITVNGWLRILNLLGGWAIQRGMILTLPWRVKMQKIQKTPRKTLPVSQVQDWISAAEVTALKSNRWAIGAAIRLMIGLGLREQEALGARWEWLDWERKTYTVGKAKGFEARVIPVPAWLVIWLESRKADLGLILGEKHPAGFTRKAIYGANQACGTPGISAHRLRGTFATLHSEAGTPIQVIQHMLGHKSPTTTMLYLEVHLKQAEEQQAKVAERMGMAGNGRGEPENPPQRSIS